MVDVHVPLAVWKERPATFVVGGTSSTGYYPEFEEVRLSAQSFLENYEGSSARNASGGPFVLG